MNQQATLVREGQEILLTIKRLGINGEGVGYYKRQVVFVPGALPDEIVEVKITKVHPKYSEGLVKKIKKASPHRVEAPCPVYDVCGGCQLQHLEYSQQLKEKRDIVIQSLERHSQYDASNVDIRPTIGMENPWNYRNKNQFQVGTNETGKLIAGLYAANTHNLIDIPNCIVQHEATNKVTRTVLDILQEFGLPSYDEKKKSGIVKTVVTRVGFSSDQVQVVIITISEKLPKKRQIIEEINKRLPEVVSIVQNVNKEQTPLIFGEKTIHLWGEEAIEEELGDLSYELSARTFFQLNPVQTVKLYDEVKKAARLHGHERVVDAYCGVGTIGLWLADFCKEVRGMDVIPESIEDAIQNAKKHHMDNVSFEVGKAEVLMPKWLREGWKPDVVVVDPPRSGLDHKLMDAILRTRPRKIVYVSCNPSTLAKDLDYLSKKYRPKYIQPVDMFPQTSHIECVVEIMLKV
ncbi:23S rRNA (uracil(1939)-C(5))-methyltransferase RlmD [Bacillus sp. FJAT-27986]|uniref:23S rRNA (uracil(1939)-C(5))-methyltransferase RlmD n=1 Tax=Bacillus sp. FJAT-27986 TaxID=1743146 RepID=UPI00080AEA97|nr:23S rRNA (uracil(1939)-C(5))-methyltransferase RlmD [Bacillus sp. FJAT-27986]OCA82599.1 23S rRNA (uracil-5-)-methyltransferase RumA [Bacillus sp. FJAT-27986]